MILIQLPEEILVLIVKKLDLQSQVNLYETCSCLRKILTQFGVVKECSVSPGPLASLNVFKIDFLKSVMAHLRVLNLCAVRGLTRSALLPALKKLRYLVTLDVSYTKIVIPDLVDINKLCPTVKDISISFLFGKHKMGVRVYPNVLAQCQGVFQQFENVEFIGVKGNLMQSLLPLYLLSKASLNNVKFTVIKSNHVVYQSEQCDTLFKFNHLQLLLLPWNQISSIPQPWELYNILLPMLDMKDIEYIVLIMHEGLGVQHVYTSNQLKKFVEERHILKDMPLYSNEPIDNLNRLDDIDISKNVIYMIWNKSTTIFDETFFSKLWRRIQFILPSHTATSCIPEMQPAPKDTDWYFIGVEYNDSAPLDNENNEPLSKKKRVGVTNHLLDFDDHLKEINKLKLNLYFLLSPTVCLDSSSNYLRKLTYVSLMGRVQFSKDFFKVLFECCEVLETLNVEIVLMPIAKSVSNSIFLSSSLKNFRLAEKIDGDNINILLRSLGGCKSIENVHIFNKSCTSYTVLNDFSFLVEKCKSLYSLYVRHVMSESIRNNIFKLLNNARTKLGKSYLNLELYSSPPGRIYVYLGDSYDPYIDVFKLNPIKRI